MLNELLKHTFRWVLLVLLQLIIFNNIQFLGVLNPFVYIFVILMFPLGIPRGVLMVLAFVTGLTVDIFSNTGGLHAFASTLIAFVRPYWIKITIPRSNYDELQNIRIKDIEFGQFITYTSVLILIHHFVLYTSESLAWSETLLILGKTFTNGLITTAIVVAFRYFDFNQSKIS